MLCTAKQHERSQHAGRQGGDPADGASPLGPGQGEASPAARWGARGSRRWLCGLAGLSLLAGTVRADVVEPPVTSMSAAGLSIAWQTRVPLGLTASVKSYYLVDGHIYIIASDGVVHALRADTGDYLWARALAKELDVIFTPFVAKLPTTAAEQTALTGGGREAFAKMMDAVVFTRVLDALFVDPASGQIIRKVTLQSSNNAAVAISPQWIYQVSPRQRVNCVSIRDGFTNWQLSTSAPLILAPVYLPEDDAVYFVDEAGVLVGMKPSLERVLTAELHAGPRGWLAHDEENLYVATNDRYLHAIHRKSGDLLWERQLADFPKSGPIIVGNSVYQHLEHGGVQCLPKDGTEGGWLDSEARVVLGQWKNHAALLRAEGELVLRDHVSGKLLQRVQVGEWADDGLSNPWNGAMILTRQDGRVVCLRPVKAEALTLAAFRPAEPAAATRPASRPTAATRPAAQADTDAEINTDERLLNDPLRSEKRIPEPE